MTPTLHVHFALLWPLEPEIVRERLSAWRDGGFLGGWQASGFRLERPPHVDAPSVVIEGEYEEGCLSGTISMHGERSDWASHVERFLEESAQIVRSLADALGLTASEDEIGAVIADPTLEGAEIASPVSLCAAPERDREDLLVGLAGSSAGRVCFALQHELHDRRPDCHDCRG